MRGGGVVNVGVPAKEVAGDMIPIVGIPIGEGGGDGEDWKLQFGCHYTRYWRWCMWDAKHLC